MRRGFRGALWGCALALLGPACSGGPVAPPTVREVLGEHAFLTPIDAPSTVAATSGGAEFATEPVACGACHIDHLTEWAPSSHALAVHDAQFFAELAKPGQPRWLCLNCHAPTAVQRAERITLDTPFAAVGSTETLAAAVNRDHEPARLGEGIGCAACHVRRDEDGRGTVVGPRGSGRAPHRVRVDAAALAAVCDRCHAPVPDPLAYRVSPSLPCWFTTREELASGPAAGTSCVDCHMPQTQRPVVPGGPVVTLRRHGWAGGGVPKVAAGYASLEARGWRLGVDVSVATDPVVVTLTNTAGHAVPTGDPERFLQVEARYEHEDGKVLASDVLRIGQTWDFGDGTAAHPARRLADDRLQAGSTHAWTPALTPSAEAARLVVEIVHVRVTEANAAALDATSLDLALAALWPEFPSDLQASYPLRSVVYRAAFSVGPGAEKRSTKRAPDR